MVMDMSLYPSLSLSPLPPVFTTSLIQTPGREGGYFLESEEGKPYMEVFREIRLQHILNDPISIEALETDRVIPESM